MYLLKVVLLPQQLSRRFASRSTMNCLKIYSRYNLTFAG
jgi:hypothetical protein